MILDAAYSLTSDYDFGVNISTVEEMKRKFHTRYGGGNGTVDFLNDEWQRYRDNGNHIFDSNFLSLVARCPNGAADMVAGKIESGMIRSKLGVTPGRSYIEGRFRMPAGRGMWPAFWMIPGNGRWPPEIDIFEIVNNGTDTTRNSFHNERNPDVPQWTVDTTATPPAPKLAPARIRTTVFSLVDQWNSYRPANTDFADGFHKFGFLWNGDQGSWYVDNTLVLQRDIDWRTNAGIDAGPAQILVNLAVGGAWPQPPQSIADFPARLDIDYVRVWERA